MPRLLIYDGGCSYCSAVAGIASLGGVRTAPIESSEAQSLLDVFDDPGFTLYLFEDRTVYWGADAAEEVASSIHMPYPLVKLIGRLYPSIVSLVTFLTRRDQEVAGPECDCAVTVTDSEMGGTMTLDTIPDYPPNSIE